MSRGTTPKSSDIARENANPAEVVASALNPRRRRYTADPTSHGFGSTKHPDSWSARNAATAASWLGLAELILRCYLQGRGRASVSRVGSVRFVTPMEEDR